MGQAGDEKHFINFISLTVFANMQKSSTPVGLEPTASESHLYQLEVRRAIHCATEPLLLCLRPLMESRSGDILFSQSYVE